MMLCYPVWLLIFLILLILVLAIELWTVSLEDWKVLYKTAFTFLHWFTYCTNYLDLFCQVIDLRYFYSAWFLVPYLLLISFSFFLLLISMSTLSL